MENKLIIFAVATVLIIAVILALTLPRLLKQNKADTQAPDTEGKNKRNVNRDKLRQ